MSDLHNIVRMVRRDRSRISFRIHNETGEESAKSQKVAADPASDSKVAKQPDLLQTVEEELGLSLKRFSIKASRAFTFIHKKSRASMNKLGIMSSSTPKRNVYLCVHFNHIGYIDTLKERFDAEVQIRASWREPALDSPDLSNCNPSTLWNPRLYVENTTGAVQVHTELLAHENEKEEVFVVEVKKFHGTFVSNMVMHNFPFDVQGLSIMIKAEESIKAAELMSKAGEYHTVCNLRQEEEQEFRLYRYVQSTILPESTVTNRPNMKITIFVARIPNLFFWTTFLHMFLLSCSIFLSFVLLPNDHADRLKICFLIVITTVTFKGVIITQTPKISYLTFIDYYYLALLALEISISIHQACRTVKGRGLLKVESSVASITAILWVGFNVAFVIAVYFVPYGVRRKMKIKEQDHLEKTGAVRFAPKSRLKTLFHQFERFASNK